MKTIITTLVLAAGFLTAVAHAENSPAISASSASTSLQPTPAQVVYAAPHLPSVTVLYSDRMIKRFVANQFTQSENSVGMVAQTDDRLSPIFSDQIRPAASSIPVRKVGKLAVFSMTPSPFSYNAPNRPTTWSPSISFPVDFGLSHHS